MRAGFDLMRVRAATARRRRLRGNLVRLHRDGAYQSVRAAIPHLRARGSGSVITIGSGLGRQPQVSGRAYSVGKAGLWMLTRCLALELRDDGIAVNELIPGLVRTDSTQGVFGESGTPKNPLLTYGWAEDLDDVVPLALFLAAQPLQGPTGQIVQPRAQAALKDATATKGSRRRRPERRRMPVWAPV
jgi:NAD(P)-dependent dehydrogenase (short-subunit alcohol dehydrogenase family)